MSYHHFRMSTPRTDDHRGGAHILLDGTEISEMVTDVQLEPGKGTGPLRVMLELIPSHLDLDLQGADVVIPQGLTDLLGTLGWLAPEQTAEVACPSCDTTIRTPMAEPQPEALADASREMLAALSAPGLNISADDSGLFEAVERAEARLGGALKGVPAPEQPDKSLRRLQRYLRDCEEGGGSVNAAGVRRVLGWGPEDATEDPDAGSAMVGYYSALREAAGRVVTDRDNTDSLTDLRTVLAQHGWTPSEVG